VWLPTVEKDVLMLADPLPGPCCVIGCVPNWVAPSVKVTDPIIRGPPGKPTLAVSVTVWYWTDGLGLEIK
jgi:hypothetical protein